MSFRTASLVLSLIGSLATGAAHAETFALTVNKGDGDGLYTPGEQAFVWANPYDEEVASRAVVEPSQVADTVRVFDRWIGDVEQLQDPFAMRTSLVMPGTPVSITAQYKDAPRWAPSRVISYLPPNHRGVIFILHGRGNCGTSCLIEETAVHNFMDTALAESYGVVLVDAIDRRGDSWDVTASPTQNVDMGRVAAVYKDLVAKGRLSAADPIYMLGISAGGVFASLFDQTAQDQLGIPVDAMALFVSPGSADVMPTTTIPTFFVLAENDRTNDGALNELALWHHNVLLDRGVPSQLWVQAATPLHPNSFWAIEGLSQADSDAIFQALKSGGLLDEQNFLLQHPDDSNWQLQLPVAYLSNVYQNSIQGQLLAAYAGHSFFSDYNHKILSFFANPSTEVTIAPSITGFEPTLGSPGTLVTISGENFVGVTDVSFNGVSATVHGDTPTSLLVSVPAGATTGSISITNSVGSAISVGDFQVLAAPELTGITPTRGPVGTSVTLSGSGLSGTTSVTIGGVPADFSQDSDQQITAVVPAGASRFSVVRVTTPGGRATAPKLFVVR